GGIAIFAAAHFLVEEALYFAEILSAPPSLIGLVVLSLGTNIPELVIAVRSVFSRRIDIALGDYLGSAAMNTLVFGALSLGSGTFAVESQEFVVTAGLMAGGMLLLYMFALSGRALTRREGVLLGVFYVTFFLLQCVAILTFAAD